MQNNGDQGYGDGGGNARNNFSPAVRRMSMDNAGSQMISSQGAATCTWPSVRNIE